MNENEAYQADKTSKAVIFIDKTTHMGLFTVDYLSSRLDT